MLKIIKAGQFEYMFDNFAFIDGSPFGRKED